MVNKSKKDEEGHDEEDQIGWEFRSSVDPHGEDRETTEPVYGGFCEMTIPVGESSSMDVVWRSDDPSSELVWRSD